MRHLEYVALALGTIALGLAVHWGGGALGTVLRDVLGDALWAAMMAWWIGAIRPNAQVGVRAIVALGVCYAVELSQLYHSPALDTLRATTAGHLVLGSGFDPRDLVSYGAGVLAAVLFESAVRRRRRPSAVLVALVALLFPGAPLKAQDPPPAHDAFSIASTALGEDRSINVHLPPGYQASSTVRFPVLYMPDGGIDEDFPHVVRTIDSLLARGAIRPVIVVGIPNTERRRDLTGPTRIATDSAIAPRVGGSAAFRRFLRDELMPAIEARYRTTEERAIVGESLAGLFIVETFLLEPGLFNHYVALDPSVWWNGGALIDSASARLAAFDAAPRTLYLATANVPAIVARTTRLAGLLWARPPRGLKWVYVPRPDLTHATIFRAVGPGALARALK